MRGRIVAFGVLLLSAGPIRVYADPVTVSGSGVVTSLGNEEDVCVSCAMAVLGFSFGIGDPLSFTLSFERPTADLAPGIPGFGAFDLGSGTFTLVGSGRFTTPTLASAQILNSETAAGPFEVADEILLGANSPGADIMSRIGVVFYGSDFAGTWLATDQWPANLAATLNAAPESAVWLFDRAAEHGTFARIGNVQFTQSPVPEPATVVLVTMGLAGIGARRVRRRVVR
jgi:hypothetical protein